MKKVNNAKEFNEKFLGSYQQEQSDPTNKNHQFDSEKTTAHVELARQVAPPSKATENLELTAYGYPLIDFTNALMPNGAPVGSRHKSAIKLAYDLLIICDGDANKVLELMKQLQWVKDVVAERGQKELDDIMESAKKLKHKRESENYYELQPSKAMLRAIENVTGRKYSALVKEVQRKMTCSSSEDVEGITPMLERIGG